MANQQLSAARATERSEWTSPPHAGARTLASLWDELVAGKLRIVTNFCTEHRCHLVVRENPTSDGRALSRHAWLLERVVLGELQKSLAIDLGLSPATVALRVQKCIRALGLRCQVQELPLLLVLAIHSSRRNAQAKDVRWRDVSGDEGMLYEVSAHRPDANLAVLAEVQRAVVRLLLEGKSCREIAMLRQRSVRTICNQVANTYRKFGVSGRVELLNHLVGAEVTPLPRQAFRAKFVAAGQAVATEPTG